MAKQETSGDGGRAGGEKADGDPRSPAKRGAIPGALPGDIPGAGVGGEAHSTLRDAVWHPKELLPGAGEEREEKVESREEKGKKLFGAGLPGEGEHEAPLTDVRGSLMRQLPGAGVLAGVEVGVVVGMLLVLIWQPWRWVEASKGWGAFWTVAVGVVAGAVVVESWLRARESAEELGLRPAGWWRGGKSVAIFTLAALTGLVAAHGVMGAEGWQRPTGWWVLKYSMGMAAQQVLLQCFLNNRLAELSAGRRGEASTGRVIVGSSVAFGMLHLPNLPLTLMTLLAGLFWTWHFRAYRNLPLLLVSHMVLGIGAWVSLGEQGLMNLRVGYAAWKYLCGG
ncbi:MAG: CPBP family intramembrane metalloprotease [Phycisphaeraceae bacterium]|nr:CPBP family intramembrane metalloprotease [Phycisphaeraceae bacterium]